MGYAKEDVVTFLNKELRICCRSRDNEALYDEMWEDLNNADSLFPAACGADRSGQAIRKTKQIGLARGRLKKGMRRHFLAIVQKRMLVRWRVGAYSKRYAGSRSLKTKSNSGVRSGIVAGA